MKSKLFFVTLVVLGMLIAPIVYIALISSDVEIHIKIKDISGIQKISKSTSAILVSVGMGPQAIVFCGKKPFQIGVNGINYESLRSDVGRCRYTLVADPPGEYFKIYNIVGESSFSYGYGQKVYRIYNQLALIELLKIYGYITATIVILVILANIKKRRIS